MCRPREDDSDDLWHSFGGGGDDDQSGCTSESDNASDAGSPFADPPVDTGADSDESLGRTNAGGESDDLQWSDILPDLSPAAITQTQSEPLGANAAATSSSSGSNGALRASAPIPSGTKVQEDILSSVVVFLEGRIHYAADPNGFIARCK